MAAPAAQGVCVLTGLLYCAVAAACCACCPVRCAALSCYVPCTRVSVLGHGAYCSSRPTALPGNLSSYGLRVWCAQLSAGAVSAVGSGGQSVTSAHTHAQGTVCSQGCVCGAQRCVCVPQAQALSGAQRMPSALPKRAKAKQPVCQRGTAALHGKPSDPMPIFGCGNQPRWAAQRGRWAASMPLAEPGVLCQGA